MKLLFAILLVPSLAVAGCAACSPLQTLRSMASPTRAGMSTPRACALSSMKSRS